MTMKMPTDKFIGAVQVEEDGRIAMPEEVLKMFGLKPGDSVTVLADKKKGIAIRRGLL